VGVRGVRLLFVWRERMTLRTNRILKKCAPFYSRVRVTEGSDSDATMRPGAHARSSSFTWLQRAFSNGPAHVPLSESPKRELRMRSGTKVGRHHSHSKKQKKHFPRLWWWRRGSPLGLPSPSMCSIHSTCEVYRRTPPASTAPFALFFLEQIDHHLMSPLCSRSSMFAVLDAKGEGEVWWGGRGSLWGYGNHYFFRLEYDIVYKSFSGVGTRRWIWQLNIRFGVLFFCKTTLNSAHFQEDRY
jgi:hypothetical protein